MTIQVDDSKVTFSSGRYIYANRGIVGLAVGGVESDNGDTVYGGYDDASYPAEDNLSAEDCTELALYMIGAWAEWGQRNGSPR